MASLNYGSKTSRDKRTANGNGTSIKPPVRSGGFGEVSSSTAKKSVPAAKLPSNSDASIDPRTAKISETLLQYSQGVTSLHRIVQNLGGSKDTSIIREQFKKQLSSVDAIKTQAEKELDELNLLLESSSIPRADITRIRAVFTKLKKDFSRVSDMALDIKNEAARRMSDIDRRRKELALSEATVEKMYDADDGREPNSRDAEHQQLQSQMAEEAINQAIIEETEAELGVINRQLHTVNDIFKDLASLVSQQQEQIDHIENQTEAAHYQAAEGLKQIQEANHYNNPNCILC